MTNPLIDADNGNAHCPSHQKPIEESCLHFLIDEMMQADDREQLDSAFLAFLENFRVVHAVAHILPFGAGKIDGPWQPIISTYPQVVKDHYREANCLETDPFLKATLQAGEPVQFSEVYDQFDLNHDQAKLFDIMAECGLADGLGMPVFAKLGVVAYFSLAFSEKRVIGRTERATLQFACQQFFVRQREIDKCGDGTLMTKRERQIMLGIMNGKSNPSIAADLGISEHTVDTYVRRLFAKIGASSRLEVAMKCVCAGSLMEQLFELDQKMCA